MSGARTSLKPFTRALTNADSPFIISASDGVYFISVCGTAAVASSIIADPGIQIGGKAASAISLDKDKTITLGGQGDLPLDGITITIPPGGGVDFTASPN